MRNKPNASSRSARKPGSIFKSRGWGRLIGSVLAVYPVVELFDLLINIAQTVSQWTS